jgi:hypothetical protein
MSGVPKCPIVRHTRAVKAGNAARLAHRKSAIARAERFPDKGIAYAAGYRSGYQTASAWWRRKLIRALAEMGKAS